MNEDNHHAKIVLKKFALGIYRRLSKKLILSRVTVEALSDYVAGDIIVKVRGHVYGEDENVAQTKLVYPKNWKEAFKERWFPYWLTKRFPVKYERHTINLALIYPELNPKMPTEKCRLIINGVDSTEDA